MVSARAQIILLACSAMAEGAGWDTSVIDNLATESDADQSHETHKGVSVCAVCLCVALCLSQVGTTNPERNAIVCIGDVIIERG
jgi:hypothetical protein